MYYIEKADKLKLIDKIFRTVKIQEDKLLLPIENVDLKEKQSIKLAEKTSKILQKTNSNKIVLSKEIQKNEVYVNMLYSYGYDIVDGKWLFEALSCKILDYIVQQKQIKKEEISISILVNDLKDYTLENIRLFASEYKNINIVTNHIEKFRKIENNIFEEQGIMITVTNNKKKSLVKSQILLNIDFPKELLNKYNINDEVIIVNIKGNMKIDKKRFNGIIINDYEIVSNNVVENDKYYCKEVYESQFYDGIPYLELMKKIKNDKLEIEGLYGINGKIL